MQLNLIGGDPGLVDTAATAILLDFDAKTIEVQTQVWSRVVKTSPKGWAIEVKQSFMLELNQFCMNRPGLTLRAVENYRPRGRNMKQDQQMTEMVQVCAEAMSGTIVDNTGIKKIVKEPLLKMFHCARFASTNHADSKSAARVALRRGIENVAINMLLADYVRDHLEDRPWLFVST